MEVEVFIEKCRKDAIIPAYARPGDAGMDVFAAEDVLLLQGETKIIATGLKFAIPKGYEIQVRPRSGISYRTPLRISNSPGTIDSGYRDELGIIMTNTSERAGSPDKPGMAGIPHTIDEKNAGGGAYRIRKGDRIAQIVLHEVPKIRFAEVDSVAGIGGDRGGGFGSTGVRSD